MKEPARDLGLFLLVWGAPFAFAQTSPAVHSGQPTVAQCTTPAQPGGWTKPAPGGDSDKVWVDASTHIFYRSESSRYGTTSCGEYMSEADARAAGAQPYFGYVEYIQEVVWDHWLTKKIDPSVPTGAKVTVHFTISRAGLISDLGLLQASGWPSLDESCIKAIQDIRQFDPLPATYKGLTLKVSYFCLYTPHKSHK